MEKILKADLTTERIEVLDYEPKSWGCYGRGLALELVASSVPHYAGRYSSENAIALVPGILTGCKVASCCRVTIASKRGKGEGLQVCNVSGNLPQKMASLSIAGLLICGKSTEKNAVLHIREDSAEIIHMPELEGKDTGTIVERLKKQFGADAAILGVGKTADMQLSLSTFFCTYPDGDPEYHCPRNGFGDIPGSKGLRAVVVTGNGYFGRECRDRDNFFKTGKRLAHIILESEVCGQALPAYGSITLLELLKDKEKRTDFLKRDSQKLYGRMQEPSVRKSAAEKQKEGRREVRKTNYCCAPMCVVGCLNRHMSNDGEAYISPDQSEVMAALKRGFNIDDMAFTKQVQKRAMDLGITGTEFVTAAKMYLSAEGKRQDRESILGLLEEIDQGTLTGRIVASRTEGILRLYPDREDLVPLLDRKAIDDEMRFDVRLEKIDERYQSVPDIEYLYDQIFVLENLGFCIFTSFALLNNREAMELMAELFTYRTGVKADFIQLMEYAKSCREKERKFEEDNSIRNMSANIPPFTKVLYRYFEK